VSFRPEPDFWGKKDFWAPDLCAYNGRYYLLVTFSDEKGSRGTAILESKYPEGPFEPLTDRRATPEGQMCLDATLYVDRQGQPWLLYCREWLDVGDGQVVIQKLSDDLKQNEGDPVVLFTASQAGWTGTVSGYGKTGYVTDGPVIYDAADGGLVMLWSSFTKEGRYAVGLATRPDGNPLGKWELSKQPVNGDHGGHAMLFSDLSGRRKISYHAPNSAPSHPVFRGWEEKDGSVKLGARITAQAKVPFGDPFIMLHNGVYYAYGTHAADGIAVYVSDDLITWTPTENLALNRDDSWGDRWFWAPEVYAVNGRFYMYYSAGEHICVATAEHPLGPFVQEVQKPMIEHEKCIDNSLFIDDDGKAWLFFDRFNDGLNIWIAELEKDLMTIKPNTMTGCIHVSQAWENVWPRVNEGCFVVKHNGIYYMTYSANSYESQFYGVGVATATKITGPWVKYDRNPILQRPRDLVGTGHSAMFTDKAGNLRIVFHAHNNDHAIHPRHMYIGAVRFENGMMRIENEWIVPTVNQNNEQQ
jgi:beta-xylosidase